jgi:hypothetical protein
MDTAEIFESLLEVCEVLSNYMQTLREGMKTFNGFRGFGWREIRNRRIFLSALVRIFEQAFDQI